MSFWQQGKKCQYSRHYRFVCNLWQPNEFYSDQFYHQNLF